MITTQPQLKFRPLVAEATRLGSTAEVLLQQAAQGEVVLYWRLPVGARRRRLEYRKQYDELDGSTEFGWRPVLQGGKPVEQNEGKPLTFKLDVKLSPELAYWFANGCDQQDVEHFEPPLLKDIADGSIWQIQNITGDPFEVPRLPSASELYVEIEELLKLPEKLKTPKSSKSKEHQSWFDNYFAEHHITIAMIDRCTNGLENSVKSAAQKAYRDAGYKDFPRAWQAARTRLMRGNPV